MEFYFGDQIRWNLGFETPNKAAAFLVSLLPFWWILYQASWWVRSGWGRWVCVSSSAALLAAGWLALIKTYSRGGLVAAGVAFAVLAWTSRRPGQAERSRRWLAIMLTGGIVLVFCLSGAADRSTRWLAQKEGSVENRYEVWRGGLRMMVAIPLGVGFGQSGEIYGQWFQPVESTGHYRTLVNSYLTFATEAGLPWTLAGLFLVGMMVALTVPSTENPRSATMMHGLRASLLAFAMAGFFSTTMEEPMLWLVPGGAVLALIALAWPGLRWQPIRRASIQAASFTAIVGSSLWGTGLILSQFSEAQISLKKTAAGPVVSVMHRGRSRGREAEVWIDEAALGANYGKLLRQLAHRTGWNLRMGDEREMKADLLIACGQTIERLAEAKNVKTIVLLAPARMTFEDFGMFAERPSRISVFVGDLDEDGRSAAWADLADQFKIIAFHSLPGVGVNLEWRWEEIVEQLARPGNLE